MASLRILTLSNVALISTYLSFSFLIYLIFRVCPDRHFSHSGKRAGAQALVALPLVLLFGYKNAYSAIIDANVTTLITAIILYIFGTGPIGASNNRLI